MAKSCKYYKQQRQVSYDNGVTWIPLDEYQKGALIEVNSSDCTSPSTKIYRWTQTEDTICVFDGKFMAKYNNGQTYEIPCDGNSSLTTGETKPSGYEYTTMTSCTIGDCVTSIGNDAFSYCSSLSSVTIPDSVTSIGESAFFECYELENIELPNGITSISNYTFEHCYSLTDVIIPNNVTSIGLAAFYDCSGITSVSIGNSVTSIGEGAFMWCESLTDIEIPNSVTSIGQSAFENCRGLTSVTISDSVASIGHQAFYYCNALTSITCLATTPPTIGDGVFNLTNNCPIYVPASSVNAYKTANVWSNYASRIQAIP